MKAANRKQLTPGTISEPTRRALTILLEHGPLYPGVFCGFMWPEMPRRGCGEKGTGDTGAVTAAGFLGRLDKAGLVERKFSYGWGRSSGQDRYLGYGLTGEGKKLAVAVSWQEMEDR